MATIYDLKPRFQALLRPLSDALARAGLSANEVTLGALLLSAAHGAWLALMPGSAWPLLLLPVTLFLRMAFNAIDGMMAKEHGLASPAGAVLNELSDVIADAALYLPFALIHSLNGMLVVLWWWRESSPRWPARSGLSSRRRAAMTALSARATAPSPSAWWLC